MRKHRFAIGLFVYIIIMLLIIFAGLFVFWQFIAAYEFSRTEGIMDDFMAEEATDAIDREIERFAAAHETVLESAGDIAAVLHAYVSSGELGYRKATGEYSADAPVYSVRLDKQELGKVWFRSYSGGPLAFGFDYWFPTRSEFEFAGLEQEYTVTAPAEAAVTVNGVTLTAENCSVSWALPEELSPYASALSQLPSQARYTFTAFSEPEAALLSDDGDYLMAVSETEPNAFTVTQQCPDELSEELYSWAEGFVKAYIGYTSNATGAPARVMSYTVINSDLYNRMLAAIDGMSWVSGVTSSMSDLTIDSMEYYGCVATVVAHYTLDTRGKISDNNMKIILAPTNSGWRVAEIDMV
ncbi:MAG: hypothetical protein NC319_07250 [Butyricicoccus sp.]|nr:hypothetical protein [Butyricicoccus sp.]